MGWLLKYREAKHTNWVCNTLFSEHPCRKESCITGCDEITWPLDGQLRKKKTWHTRWVVWKKCLSKNNQIQVYDLVAWIKIAFGQPKFLQKLISDCETWWGSGDWKDGDRWVTLAPLFLTFLFCVFSALILTNTPICTEKHTTPNTEHTH